MKFLLLLTSALFAVSGLRAEDNYINWLGDYREALRVARETRRPIFMEFRCEA